MVNEYIIFHVRIKLVNIWAIKTLAVLNGFAFQVLFLIISFQVLFLMVVELTIKN